MTHRLHSRNTPDTDATDDGGMLTGFKVGITADRRADEQVSLFERRGASVMHGPSIRTLALGSDPRLRAATESVISRMPSVVIANTGVGIRGWFSAAHDWGLGDDLGVALNKARIIARGPKASGALHSLGLEVESRASSERLVDAVSLALELVGRGDLVALQLDGRGSSEQSARLNEAGVEVIEIPVYEWRLPDDPTPAVRLAEAVIAGRVHAVTFTAGPAVRNWLDLAADHGLLDDLIATLESGAVVGCVGPVCADSAREAGLDGCDLVVPDNWRLGPLVRAVAGRLSDRTIEVEIQGSTLVIAGTHVTIAGSHVELTDVEAQVLAVLASRPDVVYSKPELLRLVWRDETANPHLVEVIVARLRRRLAPTGTNIESIYRRGYALRA